MDSHRSTSTLTPEGYNELYTLHIQRAAHEERRISLIACTKTIFSVRFSPFRFIFHRNFPHDYTLFYSVIFFLATTRKGIKLIDIFFSPKYFYAFNCHGIATKLNWAMQCNVETSQSERRRSTTKLKGRQKTFYSSN